MNYYDDVNKIKLKHVSLLLRALAFSGFHLNYYFIAVHPGAEQLSHA
jgi:hypothetical protein